MPLEKQNISISFVQGVETKVDEKQIPLGKLADLRNGSFISPGQLVKKNGSTELSASSGSGYFVASFKDQLLSSTDQAFKSYSQELDRFIDVTDDYITCSMATQVAESSSSDHLWNDSEFHSNGLVVLTYIDSGNDLYYKSYDYNTGLELLPPTELINSAEYGKPLSIGNFVFVFYRETGSIKYKPYSVLNPETNPGSETFSNTLDSTDPHWDACRLGTKIYVAWAKSGGGVSIANIDQNGGTSTIVTEATADGTSGVSVWADSTLRQLYVAYYDGTDLKYKVYDQFLNEVLSPTQIANSSDIQQFSGVADNGDGAIYYDTYVSGAYSTALVNRATLTNTGTVVDAVYLRSVSLLGKAFYYTYGSETKEAVLVGFRSVGSATAPGLQSTGFLVSGGNVIAKVARDTSIGMNGHIRGTLATWMLSNAWQDTNSKWGFSALVANYTFFQADDSTNVYFQYGSNVYMLSFEPSQPVIKEEIGNGLILSGGIIWEYDGKSLTEQNFNLFPEPLALTLTATGGSLSAGSYGYVGVYEWIDQQGQLHRSAPSVPVSISVSANDRVTVGFPTLRLTQKSGVKLIIYRTEANGELYYMVPTTMGTGLSNSTSSDSVSYVDGLADATLITHIPLYTTGDVIENQAPSASRYVTSFQSRAVSIPCETESAFEYSKQCAPGVPVEFGFGFTWNTESRGGKLLAAEPMDDKFILYKGSSIYYMNGTGPDSTGAQNDFSEPQLINTDVGLKDIKSLVIMPDGHMFKSEKGIYLLDRSLTTTYIGAEVEAFNSSTVISSVLVADTNQVRFGLSTGEVLVYDYFAKQWAIFENWDQADCALWQEQYIYIRENGQVLTESPTVFTDDGLLAQLKLTTGWISLAGLQGYKRVYKVMILGAMKSPHTLRVSVAYDFNPNPYQVATIAPEDVFDTTVYGEDSPYGSGSTYGGTYPLYEFRLNLKRQKCTSIQLTIEDTSTDPGQSMSLSGIALQVGIKSGQNRLGVSRSFT